MKAFFVTLAIVLGAILLVAVGGGLLVLLAYGVGRLVNLVLHLQPFEVTLLSLIGICVACIAAVRLVSAFTSPSFPDVLNEDEEDWEDEDFDEAEEDEDAETAAGKDAYPGIPLWRRPLKHIDFSSARPDDRCPCGSGRKYKNCHGRGVKA